MTKVTSDDVFDVEDGSSQLFEFKRRGRRGSRSRGVGLDNFDNVQNRKSNVASRTVGLRDDVVVVCPTEVENTAQHAWNVVVGEAESRGSLDGGCHFLHHTRFVLREQHKWHK